MRDYLLTASDVAKALQHAGNPAAKAYVVLPVRMTWYVTEVQLEIRTFQDISIVYFTEYYSEHMADKHLWSDEVFNMVIFEETGEQISQSVILILSCPGLVCGLFLTITPGIITAAITYLNWLVL